MSYCRKDAKTEEHAVCLQFCFVTSCFVHTIHKLALIRSRRVRVVLIREITREIVYYVSSEVDSVRSFLLMLEFEQRILTSMKIKMPINLKGLMVCPFHLWQSQYAH